MLLLGTSNVQRDVLEVMLHDFEVICSLQCSVKVTFELALDQLPRPMHSTWSVLSRRIFNIHDLVGYEASLNPAIAHGSLCKRHKLKTLLINQRSHNPLHFNSGYGE